MTEQELRTLVRETIAKAGLGTPAPGRAGTALPEGSRHSSHALFNLAPGDPEGRCMIEPGVPCNHCGYCKSYGH